MVTNKPTLSYRGHPRYDKGIKKIMKTSPKTIQIFLPDGHPRSIKIAEITNRIAQAILIPRNKLKEIETREEIKNVGVYFLFGEQEDKAKPCVYIGEAENCLTRLKQHNQSKDFWNTAIAILSKTNSFTKTHAKYLEWLCCSKAQETNRYYLENSSNPSKPFVTEPMEADLLDSFETINILLATLGYPIFELIKKEKKANLFYCKGKNAIAEGEYIEDGLIVFKGSTASLNEAKTTSKSTRNLRKKLIDNEILKEKNSVYEFTSDYIFNSPSAASDAILGSPTNGWTSWKNQEGKTLDKIIRKN